ncbi:OmpH family outer membrane protein [Chlamydiifrater phoenicopteri]|uniref:OmpH family outer membrane protein n=1 Tax=Chlamydiifrater phoenicopteri TaxID=2681469 RepID=UPI001BCF5DED|nr:OmpH family outer membrane protein [Chlamydiifrater phoenicopteri]
MKKILFVALLVGSLGISSYGDDCRLGYVSLKRCIEDSELGKKETSELEMLKKQFASNAEQMEKELTSLYEKLQDEDYMESLSSSAAEELQKKFEELSQEYNVYQNQSYQLLNQHNYKRIQKLIQEVKVASEKVRKEKKLQVVFNEEAILATTESLDITDEVIKALDATIASHK